MNACCGKKYCVCQPERLRLVTHMSISGGPLATWIDRYTYSKSDRQFFRGASAAVVYLDALAQATDEESAERADRAVDARIEYREVQTGHREWPRGTVIIVEYE